MKTFQVVLHYQTAEQSEDDAQATVIVEASDKDSAVAEAKAIMAQRHPELPAEKCWLWLVLQCPDGTSPRRQP